MHDELIDNSEHGRRTPRQCSERVKIGIFFFKIFKESHYLPSREIFSIIINIYISIMIFLLKNEKLLYLSTLSLATLVTQRAANFSGQVRVSTGDPCQTDISSNSEHHTISHYPTSHHDETKANSSSFIH